MPINSGAKDNIGRIGHGGPHVKEAVYIGAVGARFEKPGYMDWQEIVIDKDQNRKCKIQEFPCHCQITATVLFPALGYGSKENAKTFIQRMFAEFYEVDHFPTLEQCQQSLKGGIEMVSSTKKQYFNKEVYYKRIRITAETYLLAANAAGHAKHRDVHVFIVGLGLGVWMFSKEHQVLSMTLIKNL